LACALAGVDDDAITAFGDSHLICDLRGDVEQMTEQRQVQLRRIVKRFKCGLARYQQNMNWRLWIDVAESNY